MPPPVEPALAPMTMRHSRMVFEKLGHWSKSVVAKPVVVVILETWKAAWRKVSSKVTYCPRMFQAMSRVLPRTMPK